MHFYYLDEAGCTGRDLQNTEQPIFVLGGISVRDEGWNKTQRDFADILTDYFGGTIPAAFELHAEELLSPNGDGPFAGHDRESRNELAKNVLGLLHSRSHDVHAIAIDKRQLALQPCSGFAFEVRVPFLLAYDYLITFIDWFVKERLGQSARGMIILDEKPEFLAEVESITHDRRFEGTAAHRAKRIVEFSFPVDSRKNPMVQLSDLVVYCTKKFLEVDNGYREGWASDAKKFFAECYLLIDDRIVKKQLVERNGRGTAQLNALLATVRSAPNGRWKQRYGLSAGSVARAVAPHAPVALTSSSRESPFSDS